MTPEEAKKLREYDEAQTFLVDRFPSLWKGLFRNCVKEGFTETQAMDLVKAYILSTGGNN